MQGKPSTVPGCTGHRTMHLLYSHPAAPERQAQAHTHPLACTAMLTVSHRGQNPEVLN